MRSPNIPAPPRSVSYLRWKISSGALRLLLAAAVSCLVADVVIWSLTWASPRVTMPDWIFAPFFAFAIGGNFLAAAIIGTPHLRTALSKMSPLRSLPKWAIIVLVVAAVGLAVTGFAQLVTSVPGQPGYNPSTHQYYYDDHGTVIPTTLEPYLSAVAIQTRGFLAFALVFTGFLVASAASEFARRKRIEVPRYSAIPPPSSPRPRLCPSAWIGAGVAVGVLALSAIPFSHVVDRVDSYLSHTLAVTVSSTTEQLNSGHWIVYTWCETHATDAPYGCPSLSSPDIVIRDVSSGVVVPTAPDTSSDHISPDGLPAVGQLTFTVANAGAYAIHLTRAVPKGVFVDESPGSVARSLAVPIALTVVALLVALFGVVLFVRRVRWRFRDAARVIVRTE